MESSPASSLQIYRTCLLNFVCSTTYVDFASARCQLESAETAIIRNLYNLEVRCIAMNTTDDDVTALDWQSC